MVMEQKQNFKQTGQRQMKVYQRHFLRAFNDYKIFPEIRLAGKWLRDIGFTCGQSVTVRHEKNKIIITLDIKATAD